MLPRAAGSTQSARPDRDPEPPVLVVRVTAPAVDGKADAATIEALATAFGQPRRRVHSVAGERSRTKTVELKAAPETLASLLGVDGCHPVRTAGPAGVCMRGACGST